MLITQSDGTEVEVFTAEEAEEKIAAASKEAIETYLAENPADNTAVEELKATVATLQEQIAKSAVDKSEKGKDKTADLEAKLSGVLEKFTKEFDEKLSGIQNATIAETKTELLDRYSEGDAEMKKKIELEFNNYKPSETSKAAIAERMEKAYQLVTGNKPKPGFMDNMGGAGKGNHIERKTETKISDNQLAMAKMLGISDEDMKKYGGKK